MVFVKQEVAFLWNGTNFTLRDIEAHLPFICPRSRHFQVSLQYFMIYLTPKRTVKQIIFYKESDGSVNIDVYIINVKGKQGGSQNIIL